MIQQDFDTWFSKRYPGRTGMVQTYLAWESIEAKIAYGMFRPDRKELPDADHSMVITAPDGEDSTDTASQKENTPASWQIILNELASARKAYATPEFPEYEEQVPAAVNQSPFRGTNDDIVGKDGVLLATAYLNEVLGFSPRYTSVSDADIKSKVQQLLYIQQQLNERGIAFTVVITPNKATHYFEYIPDWYLAQNITPEGYKRPYTRFLALLKSEGVNHVDSSTVFADHGLFNSFPMTGIHWNSLASVPVAQAVMNEGSRQLGIPTRGITTVSIDKTEGSVNDELFGQDQDLFQTIYSQRPAELAQAIIDPYYYHAVTEIINEDAEPLDSVWIQGGSFRYDIQNRLIDSSFQKNLISSDYNNTKINLYGEDITNWDDLFSAVSYVIFEVNEQFVYNMGGSPFWEIDENKKPKDIGDFNLHDALEEYFRNGDNSAFSRTE